MVLCYVFKFCFFIHVLANKGKNLRFICSIMLRTLRIKKTLFCGPCLFVRTMIKCKQNNLPPAHLMPKEHFASASVQAKNNAKVDMAGAKSDQAAV